MKQISLDQWDRKYVSGSIEPFDQKYTMFSRPLWDERMKELTRWVLNRSASRGNAGYTLKDQALRVASRTGTMMHLFENDRPNPSAISREIAAVATPERVARNIMVSLPPTDEKLDVTDPVRLTRDIKNAAIYFGADMVGICRIDGRWVYSHSFGLGDGEYNPQAMSEEFQYAVVMGFVEDYEMLRFFPTYIADAETSYGYSRMAITNAYVAQFIKLLGHKAMSCSTNDVALTIPMAMQAGLGDLGRNGLLMVPGFGPAVRISKVLTSLPLSADVPVDFGVTEFCNVCKVCAEKCPSQAISHDKRTAQGRNESNAPGGLKWPMDAERCMGWWAKAGKPCTNCITVCPFTKPHTLFHRTVSWLVDHVRWADPLYVKMDRLFGYGKPADPGLFWDTWKPKPGKGGKVTIGKVA